MLQAFAHLAGLFQGDLTWTQTSNHHHHHNHRYDKFIIHIILLHHPHSRYPDILVGAYSSGHAVYMKVALDLTRFQQIVCGLGSLDDMLNMSISCHILFHLYRFNFSIMLQAAPVVHMVAKVSFDRQSKQVTMVTMLMMAVVNVMVRVVMLLLCVIK